MTPENPKCEMDPSGFMVLMKIKVANKTEIEQSVNLSLGGMFIQTEEHAPPGTTVDLEFQLDPEKKSIEAAGVVVWTRPRMPDHKFPAGIGIKFVNLSDGAREQIESALKSASQVPIRPEMDSPVRPTKTESKEVEMLCTWCGIAGDEEAEPQPLTEVKLDLTPEAIGLITSAYSDDVVCKRCYGAFLRGFRLGRQYERTPEKMTHPE